MPRIRSIHPGLFTDEAFVSVSDAAQIFYVGLLTEADDHGVFEWKPISLKLRLRGASLKPVDGLLEELVAAEKIVRFESGGRHYGAIRNFRKFQRPKYPNGVHPLPDHLRSYVGLTESIPEIDGVDEPPLPPNAGDEPADTASFPRSAEKSFQREEILGGDKKDKEDSDPNGSVDQASLDRCAKKAKFGSDFAVWWKAYPDKVGKGAAEKAWPKARKLAPLADLLDAIERYKRDKPPDRDWCHPATWLNQKRWLDEPAGSAETEPQRDRPNGPPPQPEEIWPDLKEARH